VFGGEVNEHLKGAYTSEVEKSYNNAANSIQRLDGRLSKRKGFDMELVRKYNEAGVVLAVDNQDSLVLKIIHVDGELLEKYTIVKNQSNLINEQNGLIESVFENIGGLSISEVMDNDTTDAYKSFMAYLILESAEEGLLFYTDSKGDSLGDETIKVLLEKYVISQDGRYSVNIGFETRDELIQHYENGRWNEVNFTTARS